MTSDYIVRHGFRSTRYFESEKKVIEEPISGAHESFFRTEHKKKNVSNSIEGCPTDSPILRV